MKPKEPQWEQLLDPKTMPIRYDGRTFYTPRQHGQIVVWHEIERFHLLREIRIHLPEEFNTPEAARRVKDEIMTSKRFAIDQTQAQGDRHEVITLQGRLNLDTLELSPVAPEEKIFHCSLFQYRPNAEWRNAPNFVKFVRTSLHIDLEKATGSNAIGKRRLLLEILVYLLTDLWGAKKAIILLGPASSGKTVLLNFIRGVAGDDGYTALSLSDLSDRFRGALIAGRPLILNDEIGAKIKNLDYVKKIISGEPIIIERKGANPYTYCPRVKLCFAANSLPQLLEWDGEGAFAKRLQVLRFPVAISPDQWDYSLTEKLLIERDMIMSCAIKETASFIKQHVFSDDEEGADVLQQYQRENDSLRAFLEEPGFCKKGKEEKCLAEEFRECYESYCKEEGLKPIKRHLLGLLAQYGIGHTRLRDGKYPNARAYFTGISLTKKEA